MVRAAFLSPSCSFLGVCGAKVPRWYIEQYGPIASGQPRGELQIGQMWPES
jgi:hypothetical protein